MKINFIILTVILFFSLINTVSVFADMESNKTNGSDDTEQEKSQNKSVIIDNFDNGTLDSSWHWINEYPDFWSLNKKQGFLSIALESGTLWEQNNDIKNQEKAAIIIIKIVPDPINIFFNLVMLREHHFILIFVSCVIFLHMKPTGSRLNY